MDPRYLLRLSNAARRKHSPTKIKIMLGVAALCVTIWAIERYVGWPEALTGSWTKPPARVQ